MVKVARVPSTRVERRGESLGSGADSESGKEKGSSFWGRGHTVS